MKCLVCNHLLNQRFEMRDGKVVAEVWEHAYEHDHPAVPIEEETGGYEPTSVCDFCGDEAPAAAVIKCLPYLVITEDSSGHKTEHRDDGDWGACAACASFFNPFHVERLLDHVRAKHKAKYTALDAPIRMTEGEIDRHMDNAVRPLYQHIADTLYSYQPIGDQGSWTNR